MTRRLPAVLLVMAMACATRPPAAAGPRLPENALPVPLVRQATTYSCGAAALLAVLFYWQAYDGGESSLYPDALTTEEQGTPPRGILAAAAKHGLTATAKEGATIDDLRAALSRHETVILDIQAWREDGGPASWRDRWEDGHYVVLVAMDARYVYVMDPSTSAAYGWIPIPELEDRWHDYEIQDGQRVPYVRLAIMIHGQRPLGTVPAPLGRVD